MLQPDRHRWFSFPNWLRCTRPFSKWRPAASGHRQPPEIRGSGWVAKSLEAALWAFHQASSFEEAVLLAVTLGDDADTTGVVCGQLAGAYWGESGVPQRWRDGLARRELIERALRGIMA